MPKSFGFNWRFIGLKRVLEFRAYCCSGVVVEYGDRCYPINESNSLRSLGNLSSSTSHLPYLDGWRGLAILLVLEGHFFRVLPLDSGRLGVDIFFCLSGFLMSGLLFIQCQPLPHFYKRRISRIIPAFSIYVLTVYLGAQLLNLQFTVAELVSTLMFLRTYLPIQSGIWETGLPIGHIWSLNVEEHCYVFMSALILLGLFRGREGPVLLVAGLGCIGVGIFYAHLRGDAPHWGELGSEVAGSFILLSAGYRLIREKYAIHVGGLLPIGALVIVVVCYSPVAKWWAPSLVTPILLAFVVNHLSDLDDAWKAMLAFPALRYFGIWSFSIYLWQQPFYQGRESIPGGPPMAMFAGVLVALVCFFACERPIRRWLNLHW